MWDFTAGELIAPASNIFDAVRYRRFVAIKLTFAAKCKCSLILLYWPAQPDNPSTIRVASVIAFSVLCLSVLCSVLLFF